MLVLVIIGQDIPGSMWHRAVLRKGVRGREREGGAMTLSGPLRRKVLGPSGLGLLGVPHYLNSPDTGDSGLDGEAQENF